MIKSQLSPKLTSFQKALTAVSLDILHAGIGGRLTPSIQLQEKLEVGSGTVQKALQEISESGGVVLRVKGHQGTLVVDFNPAILWKIAQLEPLRISLDTLSKTSYNSALISRGAAKSRNLLDNQNYSILDFGPQSYYQLGSLVMLTSPKIPNPNQLRVALDKNSYDHETLTLNSFRNQKGVEYVDCPFTEVPSVILEGKADTGIWHRVESVISPEQAGLKVSQIDISSLEDEEASISNAVLIWPSSLKEITALLGMIDVEDLRQDLQKKAK